MPAPLPGPAPGAARLLVFALSVPAAGAELPQPRLLLEAVAFAPDGKLLAAGGVEGVIRIWEAAILLDAPRP